MKKLLLIFNILSISCLSAWAADVSVVEKFTRVTQTSSSAAAGSNWTGDVCKWETKFARRGTSDLINSNQATWLTLNNTVRGYIKTTNLEGGIKAVSFNAAQFGAENDNTLVWQVTAGTLTDTINRNGTGGANKDKPRLYSHTFECHENAQLEILNMSVVTATGVQPTSSARLLVGNVTITPYLFYRNKVITIGTKQRGFINKDLIDNTGDSENVRYSIHDKDAATTNVAEIDANTGEVKPKQAGIAIVTATYTWPNNEGEVSTTYTVHVEDGIIVESFTKVGVVSSVLSDKAYSWTGDLYAWNVRSVRRAADDTIGLNPRIQAVWIQKGSENIYLETPNAFEGGVKHVAFRWRQWGAETGTLKLALYAAGKTGGWGDALFNDEQAAATANTEFNFDADVDDGTHNYVKLKLANESSGSNKTHRIVIENIKITPWLLYTTKECTLDMRGASTDPVRTFTNTDLIDNTGVTPEGRYTIDANPSGIDVEINSTTGEVTVADRFQTGDITVQAAWSEVTTTYTLHVIGKDKIGASFTSSKVAQTVTLPSNGAIVNSLSRAATASIPVFTSSNENVATIPENSAGPVNLVGVGTTTITATFAENENCEGATVSYILQVLDENALDETFKDVPKAGASTHHNTVWHGDLFDWRVLNAVRKNGDVFPSDNTKEGIWMAIPSDPSLYGIIKSEGVVEGGIKYLSFYWEQWGTESEHILKPAIYVKTGNNPEELKGSMEYTPSGAAVSANRMLLGVNDVMRSNSQLIIKNESHKSDNSRVASKGRFILDVIHITPYLLYTTKSYSMAVGEENVSPIVPDIDNTNGGTIVYSLEDNEGKATYNPSTGKITATSAGNVTVKATWEEGGASTWYTLTIIPKVVTEASYANAKVSLNLGNEVPANTLTVTDGYNGTITYASSNTAVATVANDGTVSLAGGVGQATITATLPVTENFEATSASYTIYVTDNSARVEAFSGISDFKVSDIATDPLWKGDLYQWRVANSVRRNNDMFASDDTRQGTWMGTPENTDLYGILQTEEVIEGGIKHLSFYWEQPANTSEVGYTLKPAVYIKSGETETLKHYETLEGGKDDYMAAHRMLFGISNVMRTNSQLVIKNESYKTADASRPASNRGRILLDEIHITPWLLYTDKSEQVLQVGGENYTRTIIDNTEGESGTLSYASSNTAVANVDGNGVVTPVREGYTTITASFKWEDSSDEVTTSYPIYVSPASNYETFSTNTTEHTYAVSGEITVAEDASTWKMNLAGVKHEDFNSNVAIVRAPRTDENKKAYMQSSSISGGIKKLTFYWNLVGKEEATTWDVRVLINGREVKRFTNEAGHELYGVTYRQVEMTKCVIDDINEPGNFVIRIENYSTVGGVYTVESNLNKGRFVIDNLFWESYNGTKTLAEDTENDTWIRNNPGSQTVAISRSALVGGFWNTLCLPFDLDKSELGAGADVQEMTSAVLNDNELTIGFTEHTDDNLEAGIPYLVKPASTVDISGDYTATLTAIASPVVRGIVTLQGIFSPYAMTANDRSTLFVGMPDANDDNLFYPSENGNLKGFRAYFKIGEVSPGAGAPPIKRARFVVNQPGIATGIEETDSQQPAIRKVMRDGQLIIIRDGVEYNAMGQMIQ